jgi:hypothetical protein
VLEQQEQLLGSAGIEGSDHCQLPRLFDRGQDWTHRHMFAPQAMAIQLHDCLHDFALAGTNCVRQEQVEGLRAQLRQG